MTKSEIQAMMPTIMPCIVACTPDELGLVSDNHSRTISAANAAMMMLKQNAVPKSESEKANPNGTNHKTNVNVW